MSASNRFASKFWGQRKRHKENGLVFLGFIALSVLAYWSILNNTFVADDYVLCELTANMPFAQLWRVFTVASPVFLRPLSFFSWWLEVRLIGQAAWPAHLMNVSLHGGSAFLLFWLLNTLGVSRLAAIAAGALLVLTPIGPEAVTWASGRPDVFSLFFTLLALSLYVIFIRSRKRRAFAAAMAAATAALFSKESGIIVIPLLISLELLFGGDDAGRILRLSGRQLTRLIPISGLLIGYLSLRLVLFGSLGGYQRVPLFGFPEYDATVKSLDRLLSPLNSLVVSPAKITWLHWYTATLLIVALSLTIIRWRRGSQKIRRTWLLMAVFFISTLLPVYGFVFIIGLEPTLHDSRYLYAPTGAMLALMVIGLLDFGFTQKYWRIAITFVLIFLAPIYIWGLHYNNRPWERAAAICFYVPQEANRLLPHPPQDAKLYFNNVPFWDGAYVFTIGLPAALRWQYQRSDLEIVHLNPGTSLASLEDGFLFNYQKGRLRLVRTPLAASERKD